MTRLALRWTAARTHLSAADLIEPHQPRLNQRERALAAEILRAFLIEVESRLIRSARDFLGSDWPEQSLSGIDTVPRSEESAEPLLLRHSAAIPAELVAAVRSRAIEHGFTVRLRRSPQGDTQDTAIERLLARHDPELAVNVVDHMLDQANRVGPSGRPVLRPIEVGAEVIRATVWLSAAAARSALHGTGLVYIDRLDEALDRAAQEALSTWTPSPDAPPLPPVVLVARLHRLQELTPDLAIQFLADGEIALFFASLAELSEISPPVLAHVVLEADAVALATLARALDMEAGLVGRLVALLGAAGRMFDPSTDAAVRSAVRWHQELSEGAARQALRFWRRPPAYLDAIVRIEGH